MSLPRYSSKHQIIGNFIEIVVAFKKLFSKVEFTAGYTKTNSLPHKN